MATILLLRHVHLCNIKLLINAKLNVSFAFVIVYVRACMCVFVHGIVRLILINITCMYYIHKLLEVDNIYNIFILQILKYKISP